MLKTFKSVISVIISVALITLSGCDTLIDLSESESKDNNNISSSSTANEQNQDVETLTGLSSPENKNNLENMKSYYVTGISAPIALRESDDEKSTVLAQLELGDCVRLVSADAGIYFYVYSEENDAYGYIKKDYLTEQESAVCSGETYFVANKTSLYSSNDDSSTVLQTLNKNTSVTVIAKISGDYWYVYLSKSKNFGYVKVLDLSSKKSETASKSTSSTVSISTSEYYIGSGTAPTTAYSIYYAKVNSGYLAVRSERNSSDSNIIGKLYTGDTVYALSQSGTYWYCYAPSLGIYGYINSNYLLVNRPSTPTYTDNTKWVVQVNSGYLALRTAPAYDDSNIKGKLYSGDYVYVISYNNYTDTYWYVYSPSLGMYGYVNSNYIYS